MATTFKKVSNNGQSTLYADVTTTVQTTIQVIPAEASRFPATGSFWVRVYNNANPSLATQSELMLVTGVSSNTFTVTRNVDSGGVHTFTTGMAVRENVMAQHVSDLNTAVNTVENKLDGTTAPSLVTIDTPIIRNWDGWEEANETWTYASADSPTFTFTISGDKTAKYSVGMKLKLTQTTAKYFVITGISYSAPNTTVTIYGGTDYTLANAAITLPFYSFGRAPLGFPLDPAKWSVIVTDTTQRSQSSPVSGTWYNLGSITISIPIGIWDVSYQVAGQSSDTNSSAGEIYLTLSTANNTESDTEMTAYLYSSFGSGLQANVILSTYRQRTTTLASKTSYFLNTKTTTSNIDTIYNRNDVAKLVLKARCMYI